MSDHLHQDDVDRCIDDILKMFEKRIDSIIKECREQHEDYPIATQFWFDCLVRVKEILK